MEEGDDFFSNAGEDTIISDDEDDADNDADDDKEDSVLSPIISVDGFCHQNGSDGGNEKLL